mmetsp:Transcript_26199/g.43516  ORF Transcript_26199/g.43516 Transcript_26199/m.43516 type:complete len:83 (+) Transcript_26199:2-250(+)
MTKYYNLFLIINDHFILHSLCCLQQPLILLLRTRGCWMCTQHIWLVRMVVFSKVAVAFQAEDIATCTDSKTQSNAKKPSWES